MRITAAINVLGFLALSLCSVLAQATERYRPEIQAALDALMAGDEPRFVEQIRPLLDRGDAEAQVIYGRFLIRKHELNEALAILIPPAGKGNADAQYHLSRVYFLQSPEESEEGLRWLNAAADQGHERAILVRNNAASAPKSEEGYLRVSDMTAFVERIVSAKARTFSDEKIACYRRTRPELTDAYIRVSEGCGEILEAEIGIRFPAEQQESVVQRLAECTNTQVFLEVGVTPESLARCLGK